MPDDGFHPEEGNLALTLCKQGVELAFVYPWRGAFVMRIQFFCTCCMYVFQWLKFAFKQQDPQWEWSVSLVGCFVLEISVLGFKFYFGELWVVPHTLSFLHHSSQTGQQRLPRGMHKKWIRATQGDSKFNSAPSRWHQPLTVHLGEEQTILQTSQQFHVEERLKAFFLRFESRRFWHWSTDCKNCYLSDTLWCWWQKGAVISSKRNFSCGACFKTWRNARNCRNDKRKPKQTHWQLTNWWI